MELHEKDLWFAVQVTPRHEKKVDVMLSQKDYGHFLPMSSVRRNWSDRVKEIEQPLFPGYVFCRSRSSLVGNLRRTPGIIRIISFGGKPCPIDDGEIEALQRVVESRRDICSFPYFTAGQRVQVVTGPLSGITGIISQVKKRNRLIIAVDLIQKAISVEIDGAEVVPLSCPAVA